MKSKKKGLKRTLGYVWSFIEQFNEDSASMLSNGMVYSTLIAIIPCFAVIYAILNALGAIEPVVDLIENTIMSTFGQGTGDTLVGYLRIFTENAMGMGVVSILSFGLTFVLLIDKIFTVINKIYHTPKKGKIVTRYLKYIGIIILGILAIALMVYLVGRFNSVSVRMRKLPELSGLQKVFKTLIPIALIFGLMLAMICLIPNCKVRFLSGLIGAIVGTVGVYGLVKVFQFVVSWSVKYSVIYGSLATLLFFFMFLSYLWKIIFAAVIVSYVHQTQTTGIEYEL